jgi:hypothetical protein
MILFGDVKMMGEYFAIRKYLMTIWEVMQINKRHKRCKLKTIITMTRIMMM